MSKAGTGSFCVVVLVLVITVALTVSSGAQEKSDQSDQKTGISAIAPDNLPDILAEGAAKLENSIATLRQRLEPARQTLEILIREKEDLQARVAALNALMSVKGLSLAEAREEIKNLNKDKEKTSTRLKEFTREQEALWDKSLERANAVQSVKELVADLVNTEHPLYSSGELQKNYWAYRQLGDEYDAAAKDYQETLVKSIENLQSSIKLITETSTKLQEDYLEKALKQELLKRQTPRNRLLEIGEVVLTLAALPGKAYVRIVDTVRSGSLSSFMGENWTNLAGLLLILVLLGVATVRLEKLALPRLAGLHEQVTEIGLRVLLSMVSVLFKRFFSLSFVVWLYISFWSLGIISHKVAWLI